MNRRSKVYRDLLAWLHPIAATYLILEGILPKRPKANGKPRAFSDCDLKQAAYLKAKGLKTKEILRDPYFQTLHSDKSADLLAQSLRRYLKKTG